MSDLTITRYDDREDAVAPGPTVDAVLAGTTAGLVGAWLGHLLAIERAVGSAPSPVLPALLVGVVSLAGAYAGRCHARSWRAQGVVAGLIAGAWIGTGSALPAGMGWSMPAIAAALAEPERSDALAELIMPWAVSNGITGALLQVIRTLLGGALLGLLGAGIGRGWARTAPPHVLDASLLDYAQRLALGTTALAALGFATLLSNLEPTSMYVPSGAVAWATAARATMLWELILHSIAATLVALVVRGLWRLPRTAPETGARIAVDGLLIAALVAAMLWVRVQLGGDLAAWVGPAAPWLVAVGIVGRQGRPPPPPPPERGPVHPSDAAAFSAIGVTVSVLWTAVLLWPALVPAMAVAPFAASLADDTADDLVVADLMRESTRILADGTPGVLGLLAALALTTWGVRYAAARWTRTAA